MNITLEMVNEDVFFENQGYSSEWRPRFKTASAFQAFIKQTTVATDAKLIRQFIALYVIEHECSQDVCTFLQSISDKDEEELSYYRIITDGSYRTNSILIRPDSKSSEFRIKDNTMPYVHLNLSTRRWSTQLALEPNYSMMEMHPLEESLFGFDTHHSQNEEIQRKRAEEQMEQSLKMLELIFSDISDKQHNKATWTTRFEQKVLNPLLNELSQAKHAQDDAKVHQIKDKLAQYY